MKDSLDRATRLSRLSCNMTLLLAIALDAT
jgi:hypothetical protein